MLGVDGFWRQLGAECRIRTSHKGHSVTFGKSRDASKACVSKKVLSFIRSGDRKAQINSVFYVFGAL